jgi:hypothetical protein
MRRTIMTKLYKVAIGCLLLSASFVAKADAVWPPSTALQGEESAPSRRDLPVTDRLEEDVHRLDQVLRDLKEDQQDLKKSTLAATPDAKAGSSAQEDNDGHHLP